MSENAVREGRDNGDFAPTFNFWAPYVEHVGDEYRMYYSATKCFGSSESRIWLAVADHQPAHSHSSLSSEAFGDDAGNL